VAERKPFLLRVDPAVLEAIQRWANDDLRSLNAQIEFLLRRAAQQAGRLKEKSGPDRRLVRRSLGGGGSPSGGGPAKA
jgi:hypothetical protein